MCSVIALDEMPHTGSTTTVMPDGNPERVQWDDRAALEELERVHGAIDEWRTRRKQAQAAFEEFVQGFRKSPREPQVGAASLTTTRPPAPEAAAGFAPALDTSDAASPHSVMAAPLANPNAASAAQPLLTSGVQAPVQAESLVSSNVDVPAPWRMRPDQRQRPPAYLAAIAGGVAAIITAALLVQSWRAAPTESSATRTDAAVGPPATVISQPVAPELPRTEIIALRRVWVRVTVDGTREVERELDANERIPLRAGSTFVIRAGNAGAIRLTINGEDRGTLGPEGEVMTRTVKTPPSNR
jgi:uncharacterized protein DUF4115